MDDLAPREHNIPPSQIEFAGETAGFLGDWLKEHPVVETEEDAREGKLFVDRGRLCLQDLEDDRKTKTRPLYKQITDIDDQYRSPRTILEKILAELKERLNAYVKREEERRQYALAEAKRRVEEAEKAAREAEEREREAIDDACVGAESDIGAVTKEADEKFKQFQQAERAVAFAQADSKVKIGGGFGRALSPRFKEELVVSDPMKALAVMGWSERLLNALLMDAREYRRKHGSLPHGIISKGERRL